MKLNLTLSIAMAIDRVQVSDDECGDVGHVALQAIQFSIYYRQKNQEKFVSLALAAGIFLALVDVYFELTWSPKARAPGCAAVGCFTSEKFRIWWGGGNTLLSTLLVVCTAVVAIELRWIDVKQQRAARAEARRSAPNVDLHRVCRRAARLTTAVERLRHAAKALQFLQANRLSFGLLLVSLLFEAIPSGLVFISDFIGFDFFAQIGPFYVFGLLCCGLCNALLYMIVHREVRQSAWSLLHARSDSTQRVVPLDRCATTTHEPRAISRVPPPPIPS